jgi:uncharacterized membrane protein YgcG
MTMAHGLWRRWWQACLAAQGLWAIGLSGTAPLLANEPFPHTEDWYAVRAGDPPGARQVEKHGKLWPPFPRPRGEEQTFKHKYHHTHYWPHPYVCDDRSYVASMLQQQSANGWIHATTLHDYHFDPETHQLNTAGQSHLAWILTDVPAQFRTVYIAQGADAVVGQTRSALAQQLAPQLVPGGAAAYVVKPDRFLGRPAQEIDTLQRLDLQSIPRPRLFLIGAASKGGGSSAGGGGGNAGGASGTASGGGSSSRNQVGPAQNLVAPE